eukprot:636251-Rhodomonas_salina.1
MALDPRPTHRKRVSVAGERQQDLSKQIAGGAELPVSRAPPSVRYWHRLGCAGTGYGARGVQHWVRVCSAELGNGAQGVQYGAREWCTQCAGVEQRVCRTEGGGERGRCTTRCSSTSRPKSA